MQPPPQLGNAHVICYTTLDERHTPTGTCHHTIGGQAMPPANSLAICQYRRDSGFYLFYCDSNWTVMTDTYYDSLEDALDQAEFEYSGVTTTWHYINP